MNTWSLHLGMKGWRVTRTDAVWGDERRRRDGDRRFARKADISVAGCFSTSSSSSEIHMDVHTLGVFARSKCHMSEEYLSEDHPGPSPFALPITNMLRAAEIKKVNSYSQLNLNGAYFQPVVMTAFGAMNRQLLKAFHLFAHDLVITEYESSGSSFIPASDHIPVALKAQHIRRALALAACELSYRAFAAISDSEVSA